ncbi:hypothetical protein [Butyrivibrio sp. YAB3001]|uniref:hypothetical protein n=1 Tax=Butyrivibrio sp. YAB3001 TaxID=1520812 RepID=UPI000B83A121|nr:hypothetical protein [Butyrivibrio sp. YAB3001]
MTEKDFFDKLIENYILCTGKDISAEQLGYYLEFFLDRYPDEKLNQKLTKKVAARMIHEFLKNVLKLSDMDWGAATALRDIYECRVCSNAIAQVYVRGIISPLTKDIFGLNEIVTKEQADEILHKLEDFLQ